MARITHEFADQMTARLSFNFVQVKKCKKLTTKLPWEVGGYEKPPPGVFAAVSVLGHAGLSIYFLLTKESPGGNEILTSWGTGRAPLGGLIRRCTCTPRNGFAWPGDRTRRLQDPTRGVYDRQFPTTVEPLSTAFSHIPPRGPVNTHRVGRVYIPPVSDPCFPAAQGEMPDQPDRARHCLGCPWKIASK